jgi:hypothetical protein
MGEVDVFTRQITVHYEDGNTEQPCPLRWLDNFAMRNFTNDAIFDDTIPVSDGLMEIGAKVPLDRLQIAMEEWFRKKSYLTKHQKLIMHETKG